MPSSGTRSRRLAPAPDATVRLARAGLDAIIAEKTTLEAAVASGTIAIAGDREKVFALFSRLDTFERTFEIVEPRRKTFT